MLELSSSRIPTSFIPDCLSEVRSPCHMAVFVHTAFLFTDDVPVSAIQTVS